jgi:DNA-binding NarL/FixJ family response regulator
MKLIIADDSPVMRERIRTQVEGINQVNIVGETDNGRTAMEMIMEFKPDLILLDLHMPVMGGFEVLKKITEGKIKTKVCILTNFSFPQYKAKCLALGADYFLSKSDDFEKINDVIAGILNHINLPTL